jgi:hypothetical protein
MKKLSIYILMTGIATTFTGCIAYIDPIPLHNDVIIIKDTPSVIRTHRHYRDTNTYYYKNNKRYYKTNTNYYKKDTRYYRR